MEMQVLPWIKDDVAIEIIGKMIAEQMRQVYKLVADYDQKGYVHDSPEVINDLDHQQLMMRISEFKAEIDQVYAGEGLEELYRKVDEVYAPHLKKQYIAMKEQKRFFGETKGFGFINPDKDEGESFVPASCITDPVNEHKPIAAPPKLATQLTNNH